MGSAVTEPSSQVALPIERRGEGGVIQGALHSAGARVGRHSPDAVLCLVWGQLPAQLIRQDVGLQETDTGVFVKPIAESPATNMLLLIHGWHLFNFTKELKAGSLTGIAQPTPG